MAIALPGSIALSSIVPWATATSAILIRYWLCGSRMLSRTRTFGRITPISAARFCRTRWMRSSKSPPRLRIGQPNQADAQLQLHRVDGEIVFDALGALGGLGLLFHRGDRLGLVLAARKRHGHAHAAGADQTTAESAAGW